MRSGNTAPQDPYPALTAALSPTATTWKPPHVCHPVNNNLTVYREPHTAFGQKCKTAQAAAEMFLRTLCSGIEVNQKEQVL